MSKGCRFLLTPRSSSTVRSVTEAPAIVEELKDAGIDDVYNLEGGLFDWANRDRPVYRGEKRVGEVHPFNRWWGLLLKRERRARTSGDDR